MYTNTGNKWTPIAEADLQLKDKLPHGVFVIQAHPLTDQLYLEPMDSFTLPKKIYGSIDKFGRQIWRVFKARNTSTGVLLSGEKGSGKTLLSKWLSIAGNNEDMPTLLLNKYFEIDKLGPFLQHVKERAVVIIDEFDKSFSQEQRDDMLSLFDGIANSNKLFVITCNELWKIGQFFTNRPGRMFFSIEFSGMTAEEITDYCNDNLERKEYLNRILQFTNLFSAFNFDMLQALIFTINTFDEDPFELMTILNMKPEIERATYRATVLINNESTETDLDYCNPLTEDIDFYINNQSIIFTPSELVNADVKKGAFVYQSKNGRAELTRKNADTKIDYRRFAV